VKIFSIITLATKREETSPLKPWGQCYNLSKILMEKPAQVLSKF
jgi:hypothetical protein